MKRPLKLTILALLSVLLFSACHENIDTSSRYTFRGETVASLLIDNPDLYSDFTYILQRSGRLSMLKAYGTYTCFAPTNEGVRRFLVEQDSIWRASLEPGSKRVIWTGITSPVLEELSDSMCQVISDTHILMKKMATFDLGGDVVPERNLCDRYLTLGYEVDENLRGVLYINGARIIQGDQDVENGVVHTVGGVLNPSANTLPVQIEDTPFLTIFSDALRVTGLEADMQQYIDLTYKQKNDTYPRKRYFGYTAFCEPDSVFHALGIYNVDDLYRHAREWYPEAADPDFKSPDNALWRFMAYHLLDVKLLYTRAVFHDLKGLCFGLQVFNSEVNAYKTSDREEFFETKQGTMIKISKPLSCREQYGTEMLLNFSRDCIGPDPWECTWGRRGAYANVHVLNPVDVKSMPDKYPGYNQEALNGTILLIDHPLIYDEDLMAGHVLNQIIRLDVSALIPEVINNNVRWCSNPDYELQYYYNFMYLPYGYSDHVRFYGEGNSTGGFRYLGTSDTYISYENDEWIIDGGGDLALRFPRVPAGTYEIRLAFNTGPTRGIIQYYMDDVATGIPVDMSIMADNPRVGWVLDDDTDDNGMANDKQMKNRGYLKGASSFKVNAGAKSARNSNACLRLVITTKYLTEGIHWIRVKGINENGIGLDYFELVPVGWLRNDNISVEEKRK